jgi:hypothetical protein
MRIPRTRFALRWLMVLVAFVSLGVWGWRLRELREEYRQLAGWHRWQSRSPSV